MFAITTTQEKGIFDILINNMILKLVRTFYISISAIKMLYCKHQKYSKLCKPDLQNFILISQKWQVGCYVSIVSNIGNMRR